MNLLPTGAGPLALVGSGEYLAHMDHIDQRLLAGRPPRYVQIATAAVPDGDHRVQYWHDLGRRAANRLGVAASVLDVRTRADAFDPATSAALDGAGLIYLSGGHPDFLADTLRETPLWQAIETAWRQGAALAGCSAGAMVMGGAVLRVRRAEGSPTVGLGLLPAWRLIPHFDAFRLMRPTLADDALEPGVTVVGVDEDTAFIVGLDEPDTWTVYGRGTVSLVRDRGVSVLYSGERASELAPFRD
jgi:cyanophycinase